MNVSPRILVVCYSRSGATAEFAGRIAAELDGDYERLQEVDFTRRSGAFGFLRSIADVIRRRASRLQPTQHAPSAYDLVVIGTPVWAGRPSTPVSTWLSQHGSEVRTVAFFCTMGGSGSDDTFAQLQKLARRAPVATCAIGARDMQGDVEVEKVGRFVQAIKDALAGRAPVSPCIS